jgi:hypothetical protein
MKLIFIIAFLKLMRGQIVPSGYEVPWGPDKDTPISCLGLKILIANKEYL